MSETNSVSRVQIAKLIRNAELEGTRAPFRADVKTAIIIWHSLNRAIFYSRLTQPDHISIRDFRKTDWWGECEGKRRKRRYGEYYTKVIRLQRYWPNPKKFITAIAHEMVHQYEWEILHDMSHGKTFFAWEGKLNEKGISLSIVL